MRARGRIRSGRCRDLPNGQVVYFEGQRGAERQVRLVWPNGAVNYYEGEQNEERFVRAEYPNGQVEYYEGARGGQENDWCGPTAQ